MATAGLGARGSLDGESGLQAALLVAAAVAVGAAIQVNNGTWAPGAIEKLALGLVALLAAVIASRLEGWGARWSDGPAAIVLGLGLLWQLTALASHSPADLTHPTLGWMDLTFAQTLVVPALLIGAVLSPRPWLGSAALFALVGVHFYLGQWILQDLPRPFIDVFTMHNDAIAAMFKGVSPYGITIPNMYGNSGFFYGPGLVANGRVLVGYWYPPLSLLFATVGKLCAGDFRFANLVAVEGAALLMAFSRSSRLGRGAAALFLFTPRVFYVVAMGWTEPYVVFCFALVIFLACRWPRALKWGLAALLSIKQYMVFCLPLVHLLWQRPLAWREHLRRVGTAVAVTAAPIVPFFLWDIAGFVRSVVMFQVRQPFRTDALSFLVLYLHHRGTQLPSAVGFAMAAAALGLALWRTRWSPSGFAAGFAFVMICFFAFNKQAFCNYYFFVIGMTCCAIASTAAREASASGSRTSEARGSAASGEDSGSQHQPVAAARSGA